MSGALGATLKAIAGPLLQQFGTPATYLPVTKSQYHPGYGKAVIAEEGFAVSVIFDNKRTQDGSSASGGSVATALEAYLSADGWEPKVGDALLVNGKKLRLIQVTPYSAQDTTVLWKLNLDS